VRDRAIEAEHARATVREMDRVEVAGEPAITAADGARDVDIRLLDEVRCRGFS
jgi:hypothetical protein